MAFRRLSLRQVATILYFLLLSIALPVCIYELYTHHAPSDVQAWWIGGIFVMAAVPISLWTILNHLINYTKPYLQRHIIRVLWMVPIYAIDAWFSLKFSKAAIYFNTLREFYEAYVIYNFMAFLLNYIRHEFHDIEFLVEQKQQVKHIAPVSWLLKPWPMGRLFMDRCHHGVIQYTVVRAVTVGIAFMFEMFDMYGENEFHWNKAYLYLVFINNASQIWAMYCLILFYKCMRSELKPMSPVAKFICIKSVVFMSFWQSVLIAILVAWGIIEKVQAWHMYSANEVSSGLQNFAICIEMFLAAIAHHYSFPYQPYIDPELPYNHCCWSFWTMWDVSDVRNDVVNHVRHMGNSVRSVVLRPDKSVVKCSESTPLMDMAHSDGEYDCIESVHPVPVLVEQDDDFQEVLEAEEVLIPTVAASSSASLSGGPLLRRAGNSTHTVENKMEETNEDQSANA